MASKVQEFRFKNHLLFFLNVVKNGLTGLEGCVEAQMTSFGLPRVARRSHHHAFNIPKAALRVRVIGVWKEV